MVQKTSLRSRNHWWVWTQNFKGLNWFNEYSFWHDQQKSTCVYSNWWTVADKKVNAWLKYFEHNRNQKV